MCSYGRFQVERPSGIKISLMATKMSSWTVAPFKLNNLQIQSPQVALVAQLIKRCLYSVLLSFDRGSDARSLPARLSVGVTGECPAGSFTDPSDNTCTSCEPGSAAPQPGAASCQACQPGFYAAQSAAVTCSACGPGSSSVPSSTGCFACPEVT